MAIGGVLGVFITASPARAAAFSVTDLFDNPSIQAMPGEEVTLRMSALTQASDNLIGVGIISFGIDMMLSGPPGFSAANVTEVRINEAQYGNMSALSTGSPNGALYERVRGLSSNITPPYPGASVGTRVTFFEFDVQIPLSATTGTMLTIEPMEGVDDIFTVNQNNMPIRVMPQQFASATITVVPEPGGLALLLLPFIAMIRRRRIPGI
ncbi:MAG: hypothetical protein H6819_08270 [Phycisphaerales bacterium]|nr:hypothetical protein [Phycisphaerales bacterium]